MLFESLGPVQAQSLLLYGLGKGHGGLHAGGLGFDFGFLSKNHPRCGGLRGLRFETHDSQSTHGDFFTGSLESGQHRIEDGVYGAGCFLFGNIQASDIHLVHHGVSKFIFGRHYTAPYLFRRVAGFERFVR